MCIYYKKEGLTYDGQEHIFSAAIGGKQKLDTGIVSDQFNGDFSKIEQAMYRTGLLCVPRTMLGPGKRGSLAESKATKSRIHVVKNVNGGNYGLAYTQSGKAKQIEISHLIYNSDTREQGFSCNKMDHNRALLELDNFKRRALNPDGLKIKWMEESRLPENVILIGIADNVEENFNCFFFKHPNNPVEFLKENISSLAGGIKTSETPELITYMPHVLDNFRYDVEHERLFGKTAINFLAHVKGQDFVNQECFNNIKAWVSEGADFPDWVDDKEAMNFTIGGLPLPVDSHLVLIFKVENCLVAKVIFYKHFGRDILLARNFTQPFPTIGFVCDWRNEVECTLDEYIARKVLELEASGARA